MPDLEKFCKENHINLIKHDFNDFESEFDEKVFDKIALSTLKNSAKKISMRDYQRAACIEALKNKVGILQCCTSSGKSLMIYEIVQNLLTYKRIKKILIIVPNVTLVKQIYSDFEIDYGWKDIADYVETLYSGQKPTYKKPVLITTWQSLSKKEDKDYFDDIDAVIVDECHGSKAHVINGIVKKCINTEYRIGTTGTLPTSKCDLLNIQGVLGTILYTISSKELIDKDVLTKMKIIGLILKYPNDFILENKGRSYPEEVRMTESYDNRIKGLTTILDRTPEEHNMMILCNHVSHVEETAKKLQELYPNRTVKIINGSVKANDRENIRVNVENEDGTIIVATYATCSTGLNIPKLHAIILYADSKSKIKVLQSLGRGLRKHNSKNIVYLYDIVDDLSYSTRTGNVIRNYLYMHWLERCKYYDEQEFPKVMLKIGV